MKIKDSVLSNTEKAAFCLRDLYRSYGYTQYKMSKFEEYDLYAENKSFLISDRIITFTGIGGKLMALKPDVTLSIVKSTKETPNGQVKVYYNENVYRNSGSEGDFREIMQTGLECIGDIDDYSLSEVLLLAAKSLMMISDDFVLDVSHLGILSEVIDRLGVTGKDRADILSAITDKNLHSALEICKGCGIEESETELLRLMINLDGDPEGVLDKIEPCLKTDAGKAAARQLRRILLPLYCSVPREKIRLDFSVTDDMSYYSGIVMRGFINGISKSILSGGQYDNLLRKMGKSCGALGFALYLDLLEELGEMSDEYDVDVLLLYSEKDSIADIRAAAKAIAANGKSVSCVRSKPEKLRCREIVTLDGSEV